MYEAKDEPVLVGEPRKFPTSALEDVADLKTAVKTKMAEELTHCSDAMLVVYPAGTKPPPSSEDKPLKAWDQVPPNSSGPQPLVVVAPALKQADGKRSFRFGSFLCC